MKEPELKRISIDKITTDNDNPNKMNEEQFIALKKAIEKYGYLVPIIVDKNLKIADGEHRYLAYKEMGMKEIPAYVLDISDPDRRILRQVMNKLRGKHDYELDLGEFELLKKAGKLEDLGELLPEIDIKQVLDDLIPESIKEDFEIEESLRNPKYEIKQGDIWQLGKHRLVCGDATDPKNYKKLLNEEKADLILTDPPYNVNFHGTIDGKYEEMLNDNIDQKEYEQFMEKVITQIKAHSKEYTSYYIWIDFRNYPAIVGTIRKKGLDLLNCIVWDKVFGGMGWRYRFRHEFIVFAGDRPKIKWYGEGTDEDIITLTKEKEGKHKLDLLGYTIKLSNGQYLRIKVEKLKSKRVPLIEFEDKMDFVVGSDKKDNIISSFSMNYFQIRNTEDSDVGNEKAVHPTMKPVNILKDLITNSSRVEEIVLDPFGGSGSTLIACEQLNRKGYLMELDLYYCSATIERWEKYTGKKAHRR